MAALRFEVDGEELTLEPTLNLLQDPDETSARGGGRGAGRDASSDNLRLFTLITNTLAKDKEISDRWRGFKDVADSRHLANRVEPRGRRCAGRGRARRLSAPVASLLRAEGAAGSAWTQLDHWDRNAPLPKAPSARSAGTRRATRCSPPMAASRRDMADIARRFFDERLDRRAGAARQGARRLRASDRAVGAPLRAAQLSWASRAT